MDYYQQDDVGSIQHYAFLVSDAEFDPILARVKARVPQIWADPARTKPGEINTHFGGRGFYFQDPDGHLLEVITRPYGDAPYAPRAERHFAVAARRPRTASLSAPERRAHVLRQALAVDLDRVGEHAHVGARRGAARC